MLGYKGTLSGATYEDLAMEWGVNGMRFWQSYVAGCVPTNSGSRFMITNIVVDAQTGLSVLHWSPNLGEERDYRVKGKTNLTDALWHSPTNGGTRFYKVNVRLTK